MKTRLLAASAPFVLAAAALSGCTTMQDTAQTPPVADAADAAPAVPAYDGIFAAESTLPYHAPDFSKITDADYAPAFDAGIAAKRAEIRAIADNPDAPTFDNTIVAMEKTGTLLDRVTAVFYQVQGANTNDTIDALESKVTPRLTALSDEIYLDPKLFARVKAVYDARASLGLQGEDAMLLDTTYADFVHAGANLPAADKARLKDLNTQISGLESKFSQTLTNATAPKSPVFDSAAALAGMPAEDVAAAKAFAEKNGHPGKWQIALVNTQQQPAFAYLTDRDTRKALWIASTTRTSQGDAYDTRATILQLDKLRAEKAALLGLPNYATFAMYDRMVKDPAEAQKFLADFYPAIGKRQGEEAAMLLAAAKKDGVTKLEPWDWGYYAEKVRKAKYDLDENQIKPYFNVYNVLENGVFFAANQTYGLTFKRRTDIQGYHPSMRVYEVFDKDGSGLGLFFFDPFSRANKQGGAWMNNFVEQSDLIGDKPVIVNSLNVTPPADGQPPLMTWDDVTTEFHEFGHALHGFFASQKYPSLSGTNTARDWVEFPSQFNENFASVPAVLKNYAKDEKTGKVIPQALIDKIKAAGEFNQGLGLGETVEAAALDMDWHVLSPAQVPTDVGAFQGQALAGMTGLHTGLIPPRYDSTTFRHIWSNGYSAGYYAYIWTEMLAHDGWDWVEHHGGMTRANGDHIRASFLGQGHTKDYKVMYRDFTGRDPTVQPMLEARGLDKPPAK